MREDHKRLLQVTIFVAISLLILQFYGWVELASFKLTVKHGNTDDFDPDWQHPDFNVVKNFYTWLITTRGQKFVEIFVVVFVICVVLHLISWILIKKFFSPELYKKMSVRDSWFLGQKIPSSMHAFGVGAMAVYILWVERVFVNDYFDGYSFSCDLIMAFSLAYEIYDIFIMYIQTGASPVMFIHHYALCIAYLLSFSHKKFAFVAVAMLLTELTVLPSNLHWYLKEFKMKSTRLFHFNQGLRLWSFVFIRLLVPLYVAYVLFLESERFINENIVAVTAVTIIVPLLFAMNIYWTQAMIVLYAKRTTLKDELRSQKEGKKKTN